jgi:hypothetical protein
MILPEITERLSRLLGIDRSASLTDEVKAIEPRSLSDMEAGWIRSILGASPGWENADISQTQVIAEGPRAEGISLTLRAPAPENPDRGAVRNSFGELWIQTPDQIIINVQLSEWEGRLQTFHVQVIDARRPRRIIRSLPANLVEASREARGFPT